MMRLRNKITLLFVITVGLYTYGTIDWNASKFSLTGPSDVWQIENTSKLQVLESENQSSGDRNSVTLEINHVVDVISTLSKIKKKSHVMLRLRQALESLSQIPKLPQDFAKTSEVSLLSTVVPPVARVEYDKYWEGYNLPVITCSPSGKFGNVMGEYATMYALKQLYNVSVVVHDVMRSELSSFPKLTLPKMPGPFIEEEWQGVAFEGSMYNYAPVELAAAGLFGPHRFVMQEFAFEIQLFHKYKKEIKREFTFSKSITEKVEHFFRSLRETRSDISQSDTVFVGFHVRRTDYVKHAKILFGATLPGDSYFDHALSYYRNKFPGKVVFIAASDDPTFIKEKLGKHPDVLFSPGETPLDMAVLSNCNHSIVTMGSYGFWTAFLAGGEVVYPDVELKSEYRFSRAMYEKIGLSSFTPLPVT